MLKGNADFLLFQSELLSQHKSLDLNPFCRDWSTPVLCFRENSGSQACSPLTAHWEHSCRAPAGLLQGLVSHWRVGPTQNGKQTSTHLVEIMKLDPGG